MQWTEPRLQQCVREVRRDGPVGFWPLWDGTVQATDQSGGGNPGTYAGGYTLGQPGPFAGARAVAFDGSSGCVSVPTAAGLAFAASSVAAWVKTAGTGLQLVTEHRPADGSAGGRGLYVNSDGTLHGFLSTVASNAGQDDATGIFIRTGQWVHVAFTRSAAGVRRYYVNGATAYATTDSLAGANPAPSGPLLIGARNGPTLPFAGAAFMVEYHGADLAPSRWAARYAIATGRQRTRRTYSVGQTAPAAPTVTAGRIFSRSPIFGKAG